MGLSCPRCGNQGIEGAVCGVCGGSLLVDLVRVGPAATGRALYDGARALSALGPPAPPFAQARAALASQSGLLLCGVVPELAARAAECLGRHGVSAATQSAPPPRQRAATVPPALLLCLLALAVLATGLLLRRGQRQAGPAPLQLVAGAPPRSPSPASGGALGPEEIGRRALPSVVTIHCSDRLGSGFFITEEMVLTNDHVACAGGESPTVRMHDGRELRGSVVARDPWLDLARIEVPGAGARPLRPGDSTRVQPGAPLVLIGSPKGLESTLHEGRASFVGRNLMGLGYLQFNASVSPGNSGGPLLDQTGAVVGVVTLKEAGVENIGFALLIEYALPPDDPSRFAALLSTVAAADRTAQSELLGRARRPVPVDVGETQRGAVTISLLRAAGDELPRAASFQLEVVQAGEVRCSGSLSVDEWRTLATPGAPGEGPRLLEWLRRSGLDQQLYTSVGVADLPGCGPLGQGQVELVVRSGALENGRVTLPAERLDGARVRAEQASQERVRLEARAEQARAQEEARDAEQWRRAFREGRAQVERARARRDEVAREPLPQALPDQADPRLQAAEESLQQADEQLRGLERRASQLGVPREWR